MSASRLLRCVAVVGPGEVATASAVADAEVVGRLIAERGWVTLTGGRAAGVTAAEAVFGCGVNPGTISELALRKGNRPIPPGAVRVARSRMPRARDADGIRAASDPHRFGAACADSDDRAGYTASACCIIFIGAREVFRNRW